MTIHRTGRILAALLAVTLASAACSDEEPAGPGTTVAGPGTERTGDLAVDFDWSMPPRFGVDGDDDGLIDVPNTFEYVHALDPGTCPCDPLVPSFEVVLTAAGDAAEFDWEIEGGGLDAPVTASGREATVLLPEGEYDVTLTGTDGDATGTAAGTVVVEDLLIVAMGDSYAGGEGSPEIGIPDSSTGRPVWADGGPGDDGSETSASARHRSAHRSTLAPAPQAALVLEQVDPRSSVTFVFLAATGATIDRGVLGPKAGDPALPAQIDELSDLLGCRTGPVCDRTIDHLVVSIGGNDAGFSFTIGSLIALDPLLAGLSYGRLVDTLMSTAEDRIAGLAEGYGDLAATITGRLVADAVYVTAYPDPTRGFDPDGDERHPICDEVAGDLIFALEVDDEELALADERVARPLAAAVETAAALHGWVFIDGHLDAYRGHGYCGTSPYEPEAYPGNPWPEPVIVTDDPAVRWFRTASESAVIQGDAEESRFSPERLATEGTLHPNELGHQATAAALLDAFAGG